MVIVAPFEYLVQLMSGETICWCGVEIAGEVQNKLNICYCNSVGLGSLKCVVCSSLRLVGRSDGVHTHQCNHPLWLQSAHSFFMFGPRPLCLLLAFRRWPGGF